MLSAKPQAYSGRRAQRGAVLVAVLLALLLLAGLVFYVFNLGQAAQERVAVQSAADATAHAGGGWVARSMNEVALNNINIARTIAMANVLDSLPTAVEFTRIDQEALEQLIRAQLQRGIPDRYAREDVQEMYPEVQEDVRQLEQFDVVLNDSGFDMRRFTWYDGPDGKGKCWQAMEALDAASTATVDVLTDATRITAIEAGRTNLRDSESATALVLPATVELPLVRGEFDDFEPVLGSDQYYGGLTPRASAMANDRDWYLYRGPFDALFGWRDMIYSYSQSARGNVPITALSWGADDPVGYHVYGPQEWMTRWLGEASGLTGARFSGRSNMTTRRNMPAWVDLMTRIKLRYIWPGAGSLQTVIRPEWELDYDRARSIAQGNRSRVLSTRLIIHVSGSIYAQDSAGWGNLAPQDHGAHVRYLRGWVDPARWGIDKVGSDIWRDDWSYTRDGQKHYMRYHYIFAGIDIGEEEVTVENPNNFSDRSELPAPIDFDYSQMPIDDATRRDKLTFLGVVRDGGGGKLWPARFDGADAPGKVALAQVRVYNNYSWDMWTPMWQAQLEPITGYEDWLAQYDADAPLLATEPALAGAPLGELGDYLASLKAMVKAVGLEH